jgi:uncharacterized membrane protein YdjX (TVP38/TMEM64 family)
MHAGALRAFTETHYLEALARSFAVYVTAASLLSGTVLSLTFGFLFGRWIAGALVVTAGTLGATVPFLTARYLFAEAVRERLGEIGEKINSEFTHDRFSWLLFMRLMPVFAYFLVNLIPALRAMPARTFRAATFIGILPSTLIVTHLGAALGNLESTLGLFRPETLSS